MLGTGLWFNNSKGYGFIGCENGKNMFAHYSAIVGEGCRTLQEGEKVEFEVVKGPKGPQAENVRVHGRGGGKRILDEKQLEWSRLLRSQLRAGRTQRLW